MAYNDSEIVMGNLVNITPREVWFICYRPQISLLMAGSEDNQLAAMVLMWVCMERAFTLHKPEFDPAENGGNVIPVTDKVLRWFLIQPEMSEDEKNRMEPLISILQNSIVNGLKHDSFLRPGVMLEDKVFTILPDQHTAPTEGTYTLVYRMALEHYGHDLLIGPTNFWHLVRNRIDRFYMEEYGKSDDNS